jgi:cation diffusion facilitator CzcD-associated flavoprotein CzcO
MTPPIATPTDGEVPGEPVLKKANGTNSVRERKETNGVKGTHTNGHSIPDSQKGFSIPLNTEYAYKARKLRVVTIGAGFSGLLMAHKIQHRFPELQEFVDHTIYEARSDVGGTWLINNYPGVQCDVPSHIYAFPFDPNPNWSRFYSSGEEIEEYIKSTVEKWNLGRDIQLNTKVIGATWEEDTGRWHLTVEHNGEQREDYCDVLISAQGVLV